MQNRVGLTAWWGGGREAAAGGEAILATEQHQKSQLPARESRWLSLNYGIRLCSKQTADGLEGERQLRGREPG